MKTQNNTQLEKCFDYKVNTEAIEEKINDILENIKENQNEY